MRQETIFKFIGWFTFPNGGTRINKGAHPFDVACGTIMSLGGTLKKSLKKHTHKNFFLVECDGWLLCVYSLLEWG